MNTVRRALSMKRAAVAAACCLLAALAASCGSSDSTPSSDTNLGKIDGAGGASTGDAGGDTGGDVEPDVAPDQEALDGGADVEPDASPDAPADAPAEAPDPLACPPVGPLDCSPGSGTGEADQCKKTVSCYLTYVKKAVVGVINAHPEWFDYNNPNSCPFILDNSAYMDAVVAGIVAQDLCAIRDPNAPGEEVTVKHDNDFSENFDIVASNGCARYGDLIYTSYCAPAWW